MFVIQAMMRNPLYRRTRVLALRVAWTNVGLRPFAAQAHEMVSAESRSSIALLGLVAPGAVRAHPPAGKTPYAFPQKHCFARLVNTEDFKAKQPSWGRVGRYTFQCWTMSSMEAGRTLQTKTS